MKQIIRLTESDLHRIVKESVEKILSEEVDEGIFDFFKKKQPTQKPNRVSQYWANRENERQAAEKAKRDKEYYRRSAEMDADYVRNKRAREGSSSNPSRAFCV